MSISRNTLLKSVGQDLMDDYLIRGSRVKAGEKSFLSVGDLTLVMTKTTTSVWRYQSLNKALI